MFKSKKNKPAFTLIELLVVIAIIGILATLAVVALQNARRNARDTRRVADIRQVQTALELYLNDYGHYPEDSGLLSSLDESGEDGLADYISPIPKNPTPMDNEACEAFWDESFQIPRDEYYYGFDEDDSEYFIIYCLSTLTAEEFPFYTATPAGINLTSCPFVYSWDGESYSFDSELLTSRWAKEWQGREVSRLTNLRGQNGEYKIKIAERLPETAYLNKINLIRVEHDPEVEVHFDQKGEFKTISNKVRPYYAVDDTGADILPALEDASVMWNSELNGWDGVDLSDNNGDGIADSDEFEDLYRTLELRFERPENSNFVKFQLANRVQNSAVYLASNFKRVAIENGKGDEWNVDGTMIDWLISQVSTKIEIWDGEKWVNRGRLGENYVHTKVEVAYGFDISDIKTEDLRVRIVSLPATRGIDYFYADYSQEADLIIEKMTPDIESLREIDENEVILNRGEEIELIFRTDKEIAEGKVATYFVEADGYYEAWDDYYNSFPEYKVDFSFEEIKKALEYPYTSKILMHRVWDKFYKNEAENKNLFQRVWGYVLSVLI